MSRYELLVLSSPVAGKDAEYNHWYDGQHLPDVLAIPGVISGRRYRVLSSTAAGSSQWQYVAVYEMECDDPQMIFAELARRAGTEQMPMTESLDRSSATAFMLREISRRSND